MIKSIAFFNMKGGVGKTTLSTNIAYYLGQKKKTILIDCDIQSNASSIYLKDNPKHELADVLQGKVKTKDAIIQVTDNFYLLPTKRQDSDLKTFSETKLFQTPFVFEDLTQDFRQLNFDYAIYDLSPSISQLERCVLLAVSEVVTPILSEAFSVSGINLFTSEFQKINQAYRKNIKHEKIVINAVNKSFAIHNVLIDQIKELKGFNVFTLPQDTKIRESQLYKESIYTFSPKAKIIPELNKIGESLL